VIRRAPRAALAHFLERQRPRSRLERALGALWARAADPVRPVVLPASARVIGVGGATLGGSYKTPLAAALARQLRAQGDVVSVVAHGYRAQCGAPRFVEPSDRVRDVGDDALALARDLAGFDVPVVVGRRRSEALAVAASVSQVVIVDGLLQTSPVRLDWSLLVLDAVELWGSGRCPPAGDLRARPEALLAAADAVCIVHDSRSPAHGSNRKLPNSSAPFSLRRRTTFRVTSDIAGARVASLELLALDSLKSIRVGFVCAVARPERVIAALRARGIEPIETRLFGDHTVPAGVAATHRRAAAVDLWVTTAKCRTKLSTLYRGAPVAVLEHRLGLTPALVDCAARCASPPPSAHLESKRC